MEYLHLLNPFYYSSSNKDPKKPKNYYDRIYLCIEKDNDNHGLPIKGFQCFQYHHFEEADTEYNKNFSKHDRRSTIIPICKYVPSYFDTFIVNYKLKKMFWLENHTFLKRTKKNKE
jgi:hypothetical protein